jgi:dTMP kinase
MLFITIEGIDGSGKTTQIDKLAEFFQKANKPTLITSEPAKYGTMGDQIYKIIKENKESTPICDLLLVYTLRNLHVKNVIKPALKAGTTVICGRYIDSSIAYYARTMNKYDDAVDTVLSLHKIASDNLMPNLTFLLDIPAKTAADRIAFRKGVDKFDHMKVEKMESIRQLFLHNATSDIAKNRTHIIDGTLDEDAIFDHIIKIITLTIK